MRLPPKFYTLRLNNPRSFCFKQFCYPYSYKITLIKSFLLIGLPSAFLCWWVITHTQLHFCLTPSLDKTRVLLFYKTPSHEIKRGDIVAILGHTYKYLGQKHYAKRVVGVSGDPIHRDQDALTIGTRHLSLMDRTLEGQPLTPLTLTVVPEKHVFVAGDHARSIDSRYEEFGLVPIEKVWGKGVFTW